MSNKNANQLTSREFWAAEEKRLTEKYTATKDTLDLMEAKACRIMQDPHHAGGFELALNSVIAKM